MTLTTIDSFSGEHEFLSNFFPVKVSLDGVEYPTVEHAFQAAKTLSPSQRDLIRVAPTPGKAKRLGQKVKLRKDWESVKIKVMLDLLTEKFSKANPELRRKLAKTGERLLVEGNTWNDQFWGVCGGKGKNWLGKLLTVIRSEINSGF